MAADVTAERDWFIRARVRLLADPSTGGAGSRRTAPAGEVLEMVMRGPAGAVVDTEVWQTDEPVLDALLTPADNVVVLEILEEVSPWYDRSLDITPPPPTLRDYPTRCEQLRSGAETSSGAGGLSVVRSAGRLEREAGRWWGCRLCGCDGRGPGSFRAKTTTMA
ncbi:hypothetical protein ACIRRA_34840 [Nocardia sp. NPDC101769]|uniref:hypothetical protein n=1 Tax=Nocardia sp. NPDC101769 TaxID=3364333 RepID=UPI0038223AA5